MALLPAQESITPACSPNYFRVIPHARVRKKFGSFTDIGPLFDPQISRMTQIDSHTFRLGVFNSGLDPLGNRTALKLCQSPDNLIHESPCGNRQIQVVPQTDERTLQKNPILCYFSWPF